jgi:hypothetical protein
MHFRVAKGKSRAIDLTPTIRQLSRGACSLRELAVGLNAKGITACRGGKGRRIVFVDINQDSRATVSETGTLAGSSCAGAPVPTAQLHAVLWLVIRSKDRLECWRIANIQNAHYFNELGRKPRTCLVAS